MDQPTAAPVRVETERTAKKYKKLYLAAWACLILGVILASGGGAAAKEGGDGSAASGLGAFLMLSSVVLWAWSKFGAWWRNG